MISGCIQTEVLLSLMNVSDFQGGLRFDESLGCQSLARTISINLVSACTSTSGITSLKLSCLTLKENKICSSSTRCDGSFQSMSNWAYCNKLCWRCLKVILFPVSFWQRRCKKPFLAVFDGALLVLMGYSQRMITENEINKLQTTNYSVALV